METLRKILIKLANKSCELDPVPTSIIKNHTDIFITLLKTIINTSLQQSIFPQSLRSVIVRPLLKTLGLKLVETNYRPVINLPFLGKLIEKVACDQIVKYATSTRRVEEHQAAYRAGNSTETALLRIQTDIYGRL